MKTWGEEKRAIINEYLPAELQRENRARKNKAKLRGKEEEVRTHRASKGAAGFLLMKT
jgi:hypothetical protein